MIPTDGFAQVEARSAAELRAWLAAHHAQADSVWLVTWKRAPGAPYMSVAEEVLDELIAFGWIDGMRRKLDHARTMQLISPRRQQAWAQTYKNRAARLEAEGRMHPAGLAAIAAAKAAGRWEETAAVDALEVPEDLAVALGGHGDAFSAMAPSYRRNVLRWLHSAKRPETRATRIARIADSVARGERLPQL
jgi:uncharacterized protein YdeI (YjbR/CyaY-like superfamily)